MLPWMRRFVLAVVLAVAASGYVGLAAAPAARAATCADYPNQAAAQRAADTRDGDGDGVYSEDLPCPCVKPGDDATPTLTLPTTPTPTRHGKLRLGRSVT